MYSKIETGGPSDGCLPIFMFILITSSFIGGLGIGIGIGLIL